jgi:hypothetical protein
MLQLNVFKAVAVKIAKYPYKALRVQITSFISNEKSDETIKMAFKKYCNTAPVGSEC